MTSEPIGRHAGDSVDTRTLLADLKRHAGRRHVLTGDAATRRFRTGFRTGGGPVLAAVRPGTLLEMWSVLQACVDAGVAIIVQAANTGLTGGSTPDGDGYGRPVVIVNTLRLRGVHLLQGAAQVVCLPGATLDQLEKRLRPLGREPHSVIGSSCLGASVMGGICNNSGGSLVQRGPAYTELAAYAQVGADGRLRLINHLGIALGDTPETILARLERGDFDATHIQAGGQASDHAYCAHVRDIDADSPARFNADPRRLHEAAGSAGHLAVFAVRLDTFPAASRTGTFWIGSNDPDTLTAIRRHILSRFAHLPIAGEYLHRDAFDIGDRYGKDTMLAIRSLGTDRLPRFFALKSRFDSLVERLRLFPRHASDRLLQAISRWFPDQLPPRFRQWRARYEHHLLLKMGGDGIEEADTWLREAFGAGGLEGDWFACTPDEASRAFLLRFAVAGAAVRYRAVHPNEVGDIVALDIALRRNDRQWRESLPADMERMTLHRLYYGHFFCHVMHQDYLVRPGVNLHDFEHRMHGLLDARGARYPAEHNVGHLYPGSEEQLQFFRELDPRNVFNPGVGKTTKLANWR